MKTFIIAIMVLCTPVSVNERMDVVMVADPIIGFAHKYHGILSSTYDRNNNTYYFYRDGKKCSLLNDKVIQKYEEWLQKTS